MQDLISMLVEHPPFRELEARLRSGRSCFAEGLWGSSAACVATALASRAGRTSLCVLSQIEEAEALAEDVALFAPELPLLFPAWETIEADELPDAEIRSQRLAVLMHKYQGMDYRQIADVLKLSESATKSLLFRAYETLREKLKDFI